METNDYVDSLFESWRNRKTEIRKKLPEIYKKANDEIKTIIEMLIDTEYTAEFERDGKWSANGKQSNFAKTYAEENKEIMKMIGMVR